MDDGDAEAPNLPKQVPIEITLEPRVCSRCCRVSEDGMESPCICVDEVLRDLPG